jgi:hypothetical protein
MMERCGCGRRRVDGTIDGHEDSGDVDIHTPEQACTTYRGKLRTCCQPGLATTPKLTGGHDVARGPGRIDGFALHPAWTS